MSCLVGDVLLSSAFLTYIGFFDYYYRKHLVSEWKFYVDQINMKFKFDISFIEFLSKPTDRLIW